MGRFCGVLRMIVDNEKDVTKAVLSELERAPNARFREVMSAFVRHLHAFAREVKLTEEEFQAAVGYIVALGKHTNETHNEAVLMSGSLGFSSLICLLNNGNRGQTETDANLLGPFWRLDSPRCTKWQSRFRNPWKTAITRWLRWFPARSRLPAFCSRCGSEPGALTLPHQNP